MQLFGISEQLPPTAKPIDAGGVSHEQAVKKARTEYVKYQVRTLSDVEKQYLASIKDAEAAVKKRKRK